MSLQPEAGKQRILLVTRNLPPLVGGMERLNWHMADELSRYAEVHVVGPAESETTKPTNVGFSPAPLRPLWRFLLQAGWQTVRQARRWKPDVILAGSGLTAPIALIAARLCGAKAVAYVHGLDISVNHPVYRHLWLPMIRRLDRVIANSNPTRELALAAGVKAQRMDVVYPGVSLPPPASDSPGAVRALYALGDGPLLLSVGRLTTRKGLLEFVQQVLPRIASHHPEAKLVVVGDAPEDSLHATAQSKESLHAAAKAAGLENRLCFLGRVPDGKPLRDIYYACDAYVFPVQQIPGDPEGFGMVAIEAAAHGLPTVAFACGGVIEAVAPHQSGYLVPPADYQAFADALLKVLATPTTLQRSSAEFAQGFAWEHFGSGVYAQLNRSLSD